MVRIENHCCDCATPNYPCLGSSCPNRKVPVHYCDKCDPNCENPLVEVYEVDGKELCEDCLKETFLKKTED
jgi:hypothetical protein